MTTPLANHRYRPYGSARQLFESKGPEILLSGAAGTGKSRACLEKLHSCALLNPGMRGLIVRKTAASLTSTGLVTYREHVASASLASGEVVWYGGSKSKAAAFLYGNGSELVVGGLDKATRIMSSEYDLIYVQEATEITENDWESLTTRLRNGVLSFQQLMADTNPGPPHHWLNRRCTSGRATMIFCQHEDNPRLYDHETKAWTPEGLVYLERLDNLTGVRKKRLRYGQWAAAEGLVYDLFEPKIHITRHMTSPPDGWPTYLSVDFGYTNPFVAQWWTTDPDGRLYLYREIYMTRRLVEDHAEKILECIRRGDGHSHPEPPPLAVICDHDAEDRATLSRHLNLPTVNAIKSISDGIQAVSVRLKVAGDGKPRLILCPDALVERDPHLDESKRPTCTIDEIHEYTWDPSASRSIQGASAGSTPRETPLKENDHGMDAMRYMVAFLDVRKIVKLRWL